MHFLHELHSNDRNVGIYSQKLNIKPILTTEVKVDTDVKEMLRRCLVDAYMQPNTRRQKPIQLSVDNWCSC